jgi:hypothetical protein
MSSLLAALAVTGGRAAKRGDQEAELVVEFFGALEQDPPQQTLARPHFHILAPMQKMTGLCDK